MPLRFLVRPVVGSWLRLRPSPANCSAGRRRFGWPLLAAGGLFLFSSAWTGAAEESRKMFDVPAGPAEKALKSFSEQSGRGIVFVTATVKGVQTASVKGILTPGEALNRLLAGTSLHAVEDKKSGAFTLRRRASAEPDATGRAKDRQPDPPGAADTTRGGRARQALGQSGFSHDDAQPDNTTEPTKDMKRRNPLAIFASWLALSVLPADASQSDPTRAEASGAVHGTASIVGRVQNIITGQYLTNARITVVATGDTVFTDASGIYRLTRVPAGPIVLEVFYTGLDTQQIALDVLPGQEIVRDINLTSVRRYGQPSDTVELDSFTVSSARETDGEAIAINEQRFAANIKNVIAADSLGDVMDGNVGEFLKFMPGITAEYDPESGGSVASVSVRGFPTSMAILSTDGMEMANTGNPQGSSRVFQFKEVSINNISRLEVTKVPTPATPADSMSGSIDMVTKSVFERKSTQLRYSIGLAGIDSRLSLRREPHLSDRRIHKVRPSVSFDYTLPITRNFGVVLTGSAQDRFVEQQRSTQVYTSAGSNHGATLDRPFLSSYQFISVPRVNSRKSFAMRADWRTNPNGVLSLNVERSRFVADRLNASMVLAVGNNGAPTPASGIPMSYGDTFTHGATGRGNVTLMGSGASVVQQLDAQALSLRYRFDDGTWRLIAGFGISKSSGGYQDTRHGRFRNANITTMMPVRVQLSDVDEVRPRSIHVFDNSNQEVDIYDLANYRLNTVTSTPRPISDGLTNGKIDLRRTLSFLPFQGAVQLGGLSRVKIRDVRRESIAWTYNGPDGNPATFDSPEPYRMTRYVNRPEYFGFRDMPWISLGKLWDAFQQNPSLLSKTPTQQITEERFRLDNSQRLEEAVSAFYGQVEMNLLRNRLRVLTGVRYERTVVKGEGVNYDPNAVWMRNADGSYVYTSEGLRIRRPEAGDPGSLEELRLTRTDRGYRAKRPYDGFYPSVHLTYHLRENLLLRVAYAKTYGRPDFVNIIPNTEVDETDFDGDEPDPNLPPGRLVIRNTGLKPWTADNFDLSLEYYSDLGGLFSVGAFRKSIKDFFGDAVTIATESDLRALGLDSRYLGWNLSTTYNLEDTAHVSGVEFSIRHSLQGLGRWGRYFQVFVNGTKLDLDGDQDAAFDSFIPESANWGVSFGRKPISVMAKWNYRGRQQGVAVPAFGPDGFAYVDKRVTLDLSLEAQLRPNLFFYFNGQNVFNVPQTFLRYGSQTPAYARQYQEMTHGVQLSAGIRGSF